MWPAWGGEESVSGMHRTHASRRRAMLIKIHPAAYFSFFFFFLSALVSRPFGASSQEREMAEQGTGGELASSRCVGASGLVQPPL